MNAASSIPMVYKTCLSWNRHAVLRLGFMLVLAMSESQIQSLFEFFLLSYWYLGILVSAEALNWCPGSGATGFWGLGIWHSKFEEGVFHFFVAERSRFAFASCRTCCFWRCYVRNTCRAIFLQKTDSLREVVSLKPHSHGPKFWTVDPEP